MSIKHKIKFNTEVVNGLCPNCEQDTILVSVVPEFYKCTICGDNLKQHINGKIAYIPSMNLSEQEKAELVLKDG
jgi:ribosomal protein S27E|tara:strand:+ start:37 stop:258 length:222 start_codon:yes stop_codon:yes gene_type:complete